MKISLRCGIVLFALFTVGVRAQTGTALVRHAPSINGTVDGSVQQMLGESATLNGGAIITRDWLVPGTPTVRLNGNPNYAGTLEGAGSTSPSNYQITLNGNSTLRNTIRRTNAIALPTISAPPSPVGTRNVNINSPSDSPGNFATLRNLTLNGNVGQFAIPAGTYGDFTANGGSGFTLGVAGSTIPAVYNFQRLTFNGQTQIQLLGPVTITVANGFTANGSVGSPANAAWLTLNIYSGGFTLNGGCNVYGYVNAPNGTVTVNGNSQLVGGSTSDRLIVNGSGLLRLANPANANHAPIANSQTVTLNEDSPVSFVLVATDSDGNPLTYSIVAQPTHGTLSGTAPNLTYTPAGNYNLDDSLTFQASDGQANSNTGTVTFAIQPVNDRPTADAKPLAVVEDTPTSVILSGADIDGDALTFNVSVQPSHGLITGTGPNRTYTPTGDYFGTDSFSYVASDGALTSTPAIVSITVSPVNDKPVALARSYSVNEGGSVAIVLTGTDVENSPLTFTRLSSPANGTLTGTAPNFVYQPNANFGGADSFTFTAADGQLTSLPATISINVTDLNFAPVAAAASTATDEDSPVTVGLGATDQDGDALTFSIVASPQHGVLSVITAVSGAAANVVYTPNENYHGSDSFSFKARDTSAADSNVAVVSLTVRPINDAPTANGQSVQTDEETPATIALTASDVDSLNLTFSVVTGPQHGTLGTITAGPNNSATITYTPSTDYTGTDSFTIKANDGTVDSAPASIALTVNPVNDAPVATPQNLAVVEDVPLEITLAATDVDNATLTFLIATPPQHGTLGLVASVSGTSAKVTYTPAPDYFGPDSFAFKARDTDLDSAPAIVNLTVAPQNDPPVAGATPVLVLAQGSSINFTLPATDAEGDTLTYTIITPPTHGPLSGTAPNLTYTPLASYYGPDSLVFTVSDGQNTSGQITIHFSVSRVQHAPVAIAGPPVSLDEDVPTVFTLTATDQDGDALNYLIVTPPAHGTFGPVTVAPGNTASVTYTPATNYHGSDSFVFKANDGALDSNLVATSITVRPVNDIPTASARSVSTSEDVAVSFVVTATDADGDALTYTMVTQPTHGTLSGTAPNLTYTPFAGYNGSDSFTFKARDAAADSNIATVSINIEAINNAPVASSQTKTTNEDTPLLITLTATDIDSPTLTFTVVGAPVRGTLGLVTPVSGTSATVTYTPAANYSGSDTFTFKANDSVLDSELATVALTVVPVNDAPVANPVAISTPPGTPVTITLSGSDIDSAALTFLVATPPQHGSLGAVIAGANNTATITYTPQTGYTGPDTFTFQADDGSAKSVVVTANISVALPNDPPIANAGPDQSIRFSPISGPRPRGRILVNHDEWTLTDAGYSSSPYAGAFARNIADFLTGGKPGARFLAYTNVIPGSVDFIYTGNGLAATMQAAGHTWERNSTIAMTLANLQQYDAVFLGANVVDNQVLIAYVEGGGSVYISAGTHWCGCDADGEAALWNTFLEHFGLHYNWPYNGIGGTLPVTSDHPVFHGIATLYFGNGNSVSQLNPDDPYTQIPYTYSGQGLFGLYGDFANQVFLRGSATDDGRPNPPGALTYQWTQISGPAGATIDAPNSLTSRVAVSATGSYTFRLTVSDGSASSYDDVTIVANTPPIVDAGPPQSTPTLAQPVTLAGTVQDDNVPRAATILWKSIVGPGTVTFAAPGSASTTATFSVPGLYVLELSADDGIEITRDYVQVSAALIFASDGPSNMAAWWPANGTPIDVIGGRNAKFKNPSSYTPGKVAFAFDLDGAFNHLEVPAHPDLHIGTSAEGLTIELWANPTTPRDAPLVQWATPSTDGFSLRQWNSGRGLFGFLADTSGGIRHIAADNVFPMNTWTHVALTYDKATGIACLYRNGVLLVEQNVGIFTPQTSYPLLFGALPREGRYYHGALDEIALYRRPLSLAEVRAIYLAGSDGKAPPDDNAPPVVNAGPDTQIPTGGTATLAGVVTDDGKPLGNTLTKVWSKIDGPGAVSFANANDAATTATFSLPGTYVLRLDANDGLNLAAGDNMVVRVGVNGLVEPPTGQAAWWPANGDVHEVVNGNHDVEFLPKGVSFSGGKVSQAFAFDGAEYGRVPAHADLNIGTSAEGLTIELWANPTTQRDAPLVQWATPSTDGFSLRQWNSGRGLFGFLADTSGGIRHIAADNVFPLNTWTHVALTYNKVTGIACLYRNGVLLVEQNMGVFTPQTSYPLLFGALPREGRYYHGALDEVALYRRPLTLAEVQAIYLAGVDGKSPPDDNAPPVVNAGPDTQIPNGGTATLAGVVTDDGKPAGSVLTRVWSKVHGPGMVNFANPNAAMTTATFDQSGTYVLRLDANDGLNSAIGDTMVVRVGVNGLIEPAAGVAAWWPANAEVREVINGNHDAEFLPKGVSFSGGKVSQAFLLDGGTDYGRVPAHADLNIGTSAEGLTIELWANPTTPRDAPLVQWATPSTDGFSLRQWNSGRGLFGFLVDTTGTVRHIAADNVFPMNTWTHVALTYNKATGTARLYRNGVLLVEQDVGVFTPQTSHPLIFGALPREGRYYHGSLDEITLYRRPLTLAELQTIYLAGVDGKSPPDDNLPPVVNAGPDIQIASGGTAALAGSVIDDGKPTGSLLTRVWSKVDGPGAVTFANVNDAATTATFSQSGTYVLRLDANDGLNAAVGDTMLVRVGVTGLADPASGIAAWWPANAEVHEVVNGNHDAEFLPKGVGFGAGKVSQAFLLDGGTDYGRVAAHADLNIGTSAEGLTIELWSNPTTPRDAPLVQWATPSTDGFSLRQWNSGRGLFGFLADTSGGIRHIAADNVFPMNTWTHVALTYDKATGTARLYRNGVLLVEQNVGIFTPQTSYPLLFGALPREGRYYHGALDEITLYRRPLTLAEIQSIYNADIAGKNPQFGAPVVNAGADVAAFVNSPLSLTGSATDDGLPNPPGVLTYQWTKVSGSGTVVFAAPTSAATTATFDTAGTYTLRLTASDSVFNGSDDVVVTVTVPVSQSPIVALTAPLNNQTIAANIAVTLTATASDPDGTVSKVEFFNGATKLGEDLTSPYSLPVPAGFPVGTHTLTAKATDNSGVSATSAPATITSAVPTSQPPVIAIFEPAPGSTLLVNTYFEIAANVTDPDGTIAKVEFFQGATKLGQQTLPELGHPTVYFWPMNGGLPAGTYTFTAKATDNSGTSTTSAPVVVEFSSTPSEADVLYIATPDDGSRIAAPTEFKGVVVPVGLTSWKLEYRLRPAGDDTSAAPDAWLVAATGTTSVGSAASASGPATPDVLGTFDPTSLLNGIYELRLSATSGPTVTRTSPITVIVEGNMKIGAFSLAFEDLKLPLAGIPITVTRTYDSRDARVGDFGPGWNVALANVRVQKNGNLGKGWYQTLVPGGIPPPLYPFFVEPVRERLVTVTMPDGESHRFRGGANVRTAASRIGDPDNVSLSVPATQGKYQFYPLGDTTSKLEPLNATNQLAERFYIGGQGPEDLTSDNPAEGEPGTVFNPTRFRLTTKGGTVFILDESLGLISMTDLSGNTLVLDRDGANRVVGASSTQNAPGGPLVQSIIIHRDATGRVDYIRDPAGRDLDYAYDAQGRLVTFANRENDITQFRYENASFPHYLTKIIDPRGTTALRSEFDASGKLIRQIDADGKETIFNRGIDGTGRFEKIKDRLGNENTFYYDDRGNITLKIDPLGAQTSFSYYPDSDRVKFETDHYGNVKATARDGQGNITVETIGASIAEDPANPTIGYSTRMTYNDRGAPTQITDPSARVQTFSYDPVTNNLLSHTIGTGGVAPGTTTYTYNADGTPATTTDALGNVTSNTYNYAFSGAAYPGAVKQITVTVTDPAGAAGSDPSNTTATILRSTRILFDAQQNQLAQIATRTLPDGTSEDVVTRYLYDSENRLKAAILPDGRVTETRYNSLGKPDKSVLWRSLADYTAHVDANARITSFAYDARGNLTSTTYADGSSESMHFDEENRKDWSQDRRGNKTYFTYDAMGRLTITTLPDATPGDLSDNPKTEMVYDLVGRVTDSYDELRHRTQTVYFPDGTPDAMRRRQMVQVRSLGNLVTTYTYDAAGNVRFVTDPRGNTTETVYDDQGRPQRVILPATDEHPATQTETKYDILGRRVETVDQENKVTRYRYDGLGRLFEVRQYIDQSLAASDSVSNLPPSTSGLVITRYTYDEMGNQVTQTDALGRVTSYESDPLGRRTKRTLPSGPGVPSVSENLTYDEWGNLWKRTDFAGKTTTFTYDVLNRLKSKAADATHPSLVYSHATARVEYDYDAEGMRSAARTYNASSTLLYTETTPHDVRGRLESKSSTAGQLAYSYYANGLLRDVVSTSAGDSLNVGYRYDELNRLESVDDASIGVTRTTGYSYNANGSLETMTQANTVTHNYSYDALNRLRTANVARGPSLLHTYEYKLNPTGHRRQVIEGVKFTTYTYDGLYRLTNESITNDPNANNGSVDYTLDKVGNRLNRSSSVLSVPSVVNSYNARDLLTTDTYTPNGSTASARDPIPGHTSHVTDAYDFEERLILRTKADGTTINLSYDCDGNRFRKTILNASAVEVSSTAWLVDANNLTGYAQVVEERIAITGTTTSKVYTYGSGLISQAVSFNAQPSTVNYFSYDGGHSVRELTDASGAVTDRYDYDAFGNLIFRAGTTPNAYLYRGEQYDADLGLYFLRARYLNPDSGRFWSQDSYEGGRTDPASLHKYLYAHADPVMGFDPSGHWTLKEVMITVAINATISAIISVAFNWNKTGAEFWEQVAFDAGLGVVLGPLVGKIATGLAPLAKIALRPLFQSIALVDQMVLTGGKTAIEKLGVNIARFFFRTTKTYASVGDTMLGRILKTIFPGADWQMHHIAFQQAWSKFGSATQVFADDVLANEGLRRVGNGMWNLIPIPASLNNTLGRHAGGTALFAAIYYGSAVFGMQFVASLFDDD